MSLNEIYPNLFLGNLTAAETPQILEAYAITHIISLTSHRPKIPKGAAVVKKHFRIKDNTTANLLAVLPECIERLEYILGDGDGGVDALGRRRRVLVHCRMGMSRSGGVVVAYVMKFAQCPASIALDFVRQLRPIVNPNPAFMAQLELWGACEYNTSFLEDHDKFVNPAAVVPVLDEEDEDEEMLLKRALELSLQQEFLGNGGEGSGGEDVEMEIDEGDGGVIPEDMKPAAATIGDTGDDDTAMLEGTEKVPLSADVEMHEDPIIPTTQPAQPIPPTTTTEPPTPIYTSATIFPSPASIPLPPSPSSSWRPPPIQHQLEERRRNHHNHKAAHTGNTTILPPDDGGGSDNGHDDDGWAQVVMRDGMKRCFDACLRDVGREFGARLKVV